MIKKKQKAQDIEQQEIEKEIGGSQAPSAEQDSDVNVAEESAAVQSDSEKMADEAAEWRDKYVRLSAEFDNYRKRTLKEKMDIVAAGGEDVIKSLLVVLDDIDRAMKAMESASDIESVKQGVVLINQKLGDALKAKGLAEIEAIGLPLDTDFHEAVAKFPVEEPQKGKIIDVVQKGYMLKDKVVRYAKVVVGE